MAYKHWTLEDIPWDRFDRSKVNPDQEKLARAAAMVEYRSGDYVTYLRNVFGGDPDFIAAAEQWGDEERQHGLALGRWATLVDPAYDFEGRFARFREGFELDLATTASIRGSRAGELVARCMVEVGTSSYYTAIADACEEPVLQAIARRIAADELRHYKLFYDHLKRYLERDGLSRLRRIRVALSRINETEDDELAYAFHCANMEGRPYVRDEAYRAYHRSAFQYYRDPHIERALAMIFKAVGLKPHTTLFRTTKAGAMWMLARKQRRLSRLAAAA